MSRVTFFEVCTHHVSYERFYIHGITKQKMKLPEKVLNKPWTRTIVVSLRFYIYIYYEICLV
jgi:hypothetical protein